MIFFDCALSSASIIFAPSNIPLHTSTGECEDPINFIPSVIRACVKIVDVVVPSPATSLVLLAASLMISAPSLIIGSDKLIDLLTVTPSLVTIGDIPSL